MWQHAAAAAGIAMVAPAVCVRLTFLAPTRAGWICYYANVFSETFLKRMGLARGKVEACLGACGMVLLAAAGWWIVAALLLAAVAGLEIYNVHQQARLLSEVYAHQDKRVPRVARQRWDDGEPTDEAHAGETRAFRQFMPAPHPDLVINLRGPFVARRPVYDLGDLAVGRTVTVELIVANHSIVPAQTPLRVELAGPGDDLILQPRFEPVGPVLGSGHVWRGWLTIEAMRPSGPIELVATIACGDARYRVPLRVRSIFKPQATTITSAKVSRYKGAARSAVAWRGDMDLYDPATFQSIEGLGQVLELARRYRFPSTLYLSGRLSLVVEEHREFCEHFGVERGTEQIPAFIDWMRANVALRHVLEYPYEADKPYALELGNHYYLHYGTHAAAAAGNNWTPGARIGDGTYPWQGPDKSSLGEQRDNVLQNTRLFEELFGFKPLSWAMPDRTIDRHTPAALEAAGIAVSSDADITRVHNVLIAPPPHHPRGTQHLVELTKRYPGDPEHVYHVAMLKYWLGRAWRKGEPMILMAHHHLRLFDGYRCFRMTEHLLRYILTAFNGDFHVTTVYGIGSYWERVLCPRHRCIELEPAGAELRVRNHGTEDLADIPVDVEYGDGRQATFLVSLAAGQTCTISPTGVHP